MPLITCQDCKKEISDRSTVCVHCGGPVVSAELPRVIAPRSFAAVADEETFRCSYCQSEDVKVLPLVHSQGTINVRAITDTVGIASGFNLGAARSISSGTQQSELARAIAAPKLTQPNNTPSFVALTLGTFFCVATVGMLGTYAVGILVLGVIAAIYLRHEEGKMAAERNRRLFVPAMERWQRSYLCMRCMRISDPGA